MLGDKLRQERESQNLAISDVEKGTSIRALYIECLEKGDYGQLPGEVYTKGFIRNYANFLKMDADALVRQYTEENHPEQIRAAEAEKRSEENSSHEGAPFSTGADFRRRVEESSHKQNMMLLAVICLVVAAGALFMLNSNDEPGRGSKPAAQQTAQNSNRKPAQNVKPAPAPQNAGTPAPGQQQAQAPASGVEVAVKFLDRCWIQVVADGTTLYEGTVEAGKTESWHGKETIDFTAGNAGAVEVTVNGKALGKPGEEGQVAEKTYTKTGEASGDQQADR